MKVAGIVHVHSNYSYDGKESLADLKQILLKRGINFCCLTEHTDELDESRAAAMVAEATALSDGQFIFIPGFEVPYLEAHILLIGSEVFLGQVADAGMLRQWSEASQLTVLAHPVRNRFMVDAAILEVIDAVEVWNQQYEGKLVPRPRSLKLLTELKRRRGKLLATGGTDFHRVEHLGAPVYEMEIAEFTKEQIIGRFKTGYYQFGHDALRVRGSGEISPEIRWLSLRSWFSVMVIGLGKFVNRTLARFGIKLPKGLKQLVRSRV